MRVCPRRNSTRQPKGGACELERFFPFRTHPERYSAQSANTPRSPLILTLAAHHARRQPRLLAELHWKLDPAEDLSRRRFRLRRKYHFVEYDDAIDDSTSDASRQQSMNSERAEGASPPPTVDAAGGSKASSAKAERSKDSPDPTAGCEAIGRSRSSLAPSLQKSMALDLAGLDVLLGGGNIASSPVCPPPSAVGSSAIDPRGTPSSTTRRSVTFGPTAGPLEATSDAPTEAGSSCEAAAGGSKSPTGGADPVTPDGVESSGVAPTSTTVEATPRGPDARVSETVASRSGHATTGLSTASGGSSESPIAPLDRSFAPSGERGSAPALGTAGFSAGSVALPSGEPSLGEETSDGGLSSAFEAMSHTSFSPETTPRDVPGQSPPRLKPVSRVPSLVSPARRSVLAHGEDLKGLRRAMSAVLMLTRQDVVSVSAALVEDDSVSHRLHRHLNENFPNGPLGGSTQASRPAVYGTLHSSPANWIRPGGVWRGELFITPGHFHFAGYELQEGSQGATPRKIAEARKLSPEISRRWPLAGIREVHHSRYLLQPSALELFMSDRRSHAMFSFPSAQVSRWGGMGPIGLDARRWPPMVGSCAFSLSLAVSTFAWSKQRPCPLSPAFASPHLSIALLSCTRSFGENFLRLWGSTVPTSSSSIEIARWTWRSSSSSSGSSAWERGGNSRSERRWRACQAASVEYSKARVGALEGPGAAVRRALRPAPQTLSGFAVECPGLDICSFTSEIFIVLLAQLEPQQL